MIIPIEIDGSQLQQLFNLNKTQIESICDNIAKTMAARYAQQLQAEAQSALHQTRRRYLQNIKVIDSGKMEGTVLLDYSKDPMIKMLEEGASPFDIKAGLMNSPKVKIGRKGGKYITIPFRWGTPGIIGDSDVFSGIMPQEVYSVVRIQQATIPVTGGSAMRSPGLSNGQLPAGFSQPQTRVTIQDTAGKTLFKQYQHKTSIYAGISKKTDSTTGQSTYNSFRRVSENGSDKDAFIHPGIQRYGLIQKALQKFDQAKELSVALDTQLARLGF